MNKDSGSRDRASEEQLHELVRRLATSLAPQQIYAFGSHVYGTPTAASDVDVLIVVEDASALDVGALKRVHEALAGLFLPIELHSRSQQNFERRKAIRATLEHEVATKGRLLYAA